MSSLTSSYAGALILASMAALGAAYLGDKASTTVKMPEVALPTVLTASTSGTGAIVPATAPTGINRLIPNFPSVTSSMTEDEARTKLAPFAEPPAIDAMFKFVKTPVSEWNTLGDLNKLLLAATVHESKCREPLLKVCALVYEKYSQMKGTSKGEPPLRDPGNVWDKFAYLVSKLPSQTMLQLQDRATAVRGQLTAAQDAARGHLSTAKDAAAAAQARLTTGVADAQARLTTGVADAQKRATDAAAAAKDRLTTGVADAQKRATDAAAALRRRFSFSSAAPEAPATEQAPEASAAPVVPPAPVVPATEQAPVVPAAPVVPEAPAAPATEQAPVVPEAPVVPATEQAPEASAAPEAPATEQAPEAPAESSGIGDTTYIKERPWLNPIAAPTSETRLSSWVDSLAEDARLAASQQAETRVEREIAADASLRDAKFRESEATHRATQLARTNAILNDPVPVPQAARIESRTSNPANAYIAQLPPSRETGPVRPIIRNLSRTTVATKASEIVDYLKALRVQTRDDQRVSRERVEMLDEFFRAIARGKSDGKLSDPRDSTVIKFAQQKINGASRRTRRQQDHF